MAYETIGIGTTANDGTGDDLRTAGGKINDNFAKAIENNKVVIPASAMLPMTTGSAYYMESDRWPAQVFSGTANQSCKFQLFNIGNQIPAAANAIKATLFVGDAGTLTGSTSGWKVQAAWINAGDDAVTYGTQQYTDVNHIGNEIVESDQTAAITPSGTKADGCGLWVKINRLAEEQGDDLLNNAHLVWVEIEFVTV